MITETQDNNFVSTPSEKERDIIEALRFFLEHNISTKSSKTVLYELEVLKADIADLKEHKHNVMEIEDMPTKLPADGGNADTVGGLFPEDFAAAEHEHDEYASKDEFEMHEHDTEYANLQDFNELIQTVALIDQELADSLKVLAEHNHDDYYAAIEHLHDDLYAAINHTHTEEYDLRYALKEDFEAHEHDYTPVNDFNTLQSLFEQHNHDEQYAEKEHTHDGYITTEQFANHTHEDFANKDHTHENLATKTELTEVTTANAQTLENLNALEEEFKTHTHDDLASKDHTHVDLYATIEDLGSHNHDETYVTKTDFDAHNHDDDYVKVADKAEHGHTSENISDLEEVVGTMTALNATKLNDKDASLYALKEDIPDVSNIVKDTNISGAGVAIGGDNNEISELANNSAILGGEDNSLPNDSSDNSGIIGGKGNTIEAEGSVAIGGNDLVSWSKNTIVGGTYNLATKNSPTEVDISDNQELFVLGNGYKKQTDTEARESASNAFTVYANGLVNTFSGYSANIPSVAIAFEYTDGNVNDDPRTGLFVNLGETIDIATDNTGVLGVVVDKAGIELNTYDEFWQGKYVKNEGSDSIKYITLTESVEVEKDGIVETKTIETVVPEISSAFDSTLTYIPRRNRKEWALVATSGIVTMKQDGTCVAGDMCVPATTGVATKSTDGTGKLVLKVLTSGFVSVLL